VQQRAWISEEWGFQRLEAAWGRHIQRRQEVKRGGSALLLGTVRHLVWRMRLARNV